MNYFWDVVDWLLPPVRIIDDLADHPSESSYRKTTHHHSSHPSRRLSGKEHDRDRDRDRERRREKEKERERGSWRDRERTRERERPRERERTRDREREREREVRASSDADKEREQLRQRVQQLERENDSLLEQLRSTREELSRLSTAVFPTPDSRASQPLPASYPASPTDALGLVHPVPPAHTPTPTPISPTSSTSPAAAQYSAEAALTDPKRLRVLYTSLRATYTDARQTIRSQAEELASLKGFLSKTDDWSGAQLLQALADLNSEIIQLAASVAEEFAADLRADVRAPAVAKERDREVVRGALGREMLRLLEGREHAPDPTLVQFALQAWEVWCVTRVMDAFCYGLPPDVDESLRRIFDRMQRQEPQPTTSRWRALTYRHARSLLTPRLAASEVSTPDTATPSPFNSAPASIASSSALPAQLLSLTEANLRGVLAILALAGCTDARGLHREPLRARYGSALARISARAERISGVVKEGVLSGLFEVVWCQPCRASPKAKPAALGVGVGVGVGAEAANGSGSAAEAAAADPAQPAKLDGIDINEIGANRGKGKEREWVEEVERARNGGDEEAREPEQEQLGAKEMFDWATMENVYAGHCNERCHVLCTVELGLAFTRRLPAEEREESVDGDGMVVSHASAGSRPVSSLSRPASMGGVGLDGMAGERHFVVWFAVRRCVAGGQRGRARVRTSRCTVAMQSQIYLLGTVQLPRTRCRHPHRDPHVPRAGLVRPSRLRIRVCRLSPHSETRYKSERSSAADAPAVNEDEMDTGPQMSRTGVSAEQILWQVGVEDSPVHGWDGWPSPFPLSPDSSSVKMVGEPTRTEPRDSTKSRTGVSTGRMVSPASQLMLLDILQVRLHGHLAGDARRELRQLWTQALLLVRSRQMR